MPSRGIYKGIGTTSVAYKVLTVKAIFERNKIL